MLLVFIVFIISSKACSYNAFCIVLLRTWSVSVKWYDNEVRELIAVNITVVAFKELPLGSCVPMPAPSTRFKTILELVLWNGLQGCRRITPDIIHVIKMTSFQYCKLLFSSWNYGRKLVLIFLWFGFHSGQVKYEAPTLSRRHTKTHSDNNRRHLERDCHRSTTTQLWNADMPTSIKNRTEVSIHCCHGKHTVASSRTLLSDLVYPETQPT
jgi:hypothetical protein